MRGNGFLYQQLCIKGRQPSDERKTHQSIRALIDSRLKLVFTLIVLIL